MLDLDTGEIVADLNSRKFALSVTYSPDGRHLVAASAPARERAEPSEICVWDAETYELVRSSQADVSRSSYVRHDPSGRWIATSSSNFTALLLDAASLEPVARLKGHEDRIRSLAFSPDGKRLATASFDGTTRIWAVPGGKELGVLEGHTNHVYGVCWSHDGSRLFTASQDHSIKVWDAEHAEELATIFGHEDYAYSVSAHPDGDALLSTGGDGTARVWGTRSRREVVEEARSYREVAQRLAPRLERLATLPHHEAAAELSSDASLTERERQISRQLLFGRRVESKIR